MLLSQGRKNSSFAPYFSGLENSGGGSSYKTRDQPETWSEISSYSEENLHKGHPRTNQVVSDFLQAMSEVNYLICHSLFLPVPTPRLCLFLFTLSSTFFYRGLFPLIFPSLFYLYFHYGYSAEQTESMVNVFSPVVSTFLSISPNTCSIWWHLTFWV